MLATVLLCVGLCAAAEFKSDEAKKGAADFDAAVKAAKMKYAAELVAAKDALDEKKEATTDAIARDALQKESELVTQELVRLHEDIKGKTAGEPKELRTEAPRKAAADYAAAIKAARNKYIQDLVAAQKAVLTRKAASADAPVKEAYQQELDLIAEELRQLREEAKGGKPKPQAAATKPGASATSAGALTVDLGKGATMKMVLIRPGKFIMGSPDSEQGRETDEGPQHEVTITKAFYLGVTEVTQEQYEAVTGINPSKIKGPTNPVEQVSYDDAVEFCRRLCEKTGKAFRLPTEAEWEYACRAGTATRFSFGETASALGEYAWCGANSGAKSRPVAQKKPNGWGLYDMHGNVYEWCSDRYGPYSGGASADPQGAGADLRYMLRGGSWSSNSQDYLRCAYREFFTAVGRRPIVGLRCARAL